MNGLEVYNEDGSLQFTTTDNLTRFLMTFTIGSSAGTQVVPGLSSGRPLAIASPIISGSTSFLGVGTPPFTYNLQAETVSWPSSSFASGYTVTVVVY